MICTEPHVISSTNVSYAWTRAFLYAMDGNSHEFSPLVVSINASAAGEPLEDPEVRDLVDRTLCKEDKVSVGDNAFMLFPYSVWERRGRPDSKWFFQRCLEMLPKLRARSHKNQYGVYFERMLAFTGIKKGEVKQINQLEHILKMWKRTKAKGRRPRTSALQTAVFDPAKDHTGQALRGFPCLQQVSFSFDDHGGLVVGGFYPTQYIFDRGYGNYLGLCHLGVFMAYEMGLRFARLNCFVNSPCLGSVRKSSLRRLKEHLLSILKQKEAHAN